MRDDGASVRFAGPAADDAALALRNTGNRRWRWLRRGLRFELRTGRMTKRSTTRS